MKSIFYKLQMIKLKFPSFHLARIANDSMCLIGCLIDGSGQRSYLTHWTFDKSKIVEFICETVMCRGFTYASNLDFAALGLHSWSVACRCRRQKFNLHWPQWTGINSFFLQPLNEHLLVNILVLSDLQYWSICCPTVMSGDTPLGVGTQAPHKGHAGTCTSFLWAEVHLCFW